MQQHQPFASHTGLKRHKQQTVMMVTRILVMASPAPSMRASEGRLLKTPSSALSTVYL